ncbi:tape measure protein [Bordetella petrii]|uniref:Possible bacteriophage-related transmembrane protein n=1 Tax=Bordetella petrii (strain ATCC BAA-461 / DSM 12804 / CCUG 43448 / CIP 107267 / Se-1111R) TaxID=340100 RepID=A9I932_BORPD|nr:tape measure protein [Bordetella petrii]CAP41322.1 possible bacteriophage-related transmembrane protein [Bordetella petrii]
MAVVRELVTLLRYQVDQSGLRAYQQRATMVADRLRRGMQVVREAGVGAMQGVRLGVQDVLRDQRALNAAQRQSVAETKQMGDGYSRVGGLIRGVLAGVSALSAARVADEWASVRGRVSLVTDGIVEQEQALRSLFQIAQDTRQQYVATADLFQSVQRNRKELDLTLADSLQLTKAIGQALTIGGGSTSAQQAALVQLGQALGAGALRGDELNSIIEQSPRLAQAIAEAFDVPVGKLKELGEQGKLASKELAKGLLKQSEKLAREFDRMPKTFGAAWTLIANKWGQIVDSMNRATSASELFFAVTKRLVDNLGDIAKVGALAALSYGIVRVTRLLRTMRVAAWASLGPYLAIAAALAAIYLVGQDIWVWLQGGDSILGTLVGRVEDWQFQLDTILIAAKEIWWAIEDIATALANSAAQSLGLGREFTGLGDIARTVFQGILDVIKWTLGIIRDLLKGLAAMLRGDWDAAAKHIESAFTGLIKPLVFLGSKAVEIMQNIGKAIQVWVTDKLHAAKRALEALVPAGWSDSEQAKRMQAVNSTLREYLPDFLFGNAYGVTPASVQRVGAGSNVTVQNNIGGVTVNAPNTNPASVAAATQKGVGGALNRYGNPFGSEVPMVEVSP